MLSKKNRLAKAKDIQKAFAQGRNFFSPFFTVRFVPKSGQPRFTVVVSTKVFKNAVDRNRTKRVIREYLRTHLTDFKPGDHVIIVKPKLVQLPQDQIVPKLLATIFKK